MLPHTMEVTADLWIGCQRYSEPVQPYDGVILGRLQIVEEIGLDDGVTALQQLGLLRAA